MTAANDIPAFPCPMGPDYPECDRGMSLRDFYAGLAMGGFLASGNEIAINGETVPHVTAAFRVADAMLAERAKGGR